MRRKGAKKISKFNKENTLRIFYFFYKKNAYIIRE